MLSDPMAPSNSHRMVKYVRPTVIVVAVAVTIVGLLTVSSGIKISTKATEAVVNKAGVHPKTNYFGGDVVKIQNQKNWQDCQKFCCNVAQAYSIAVKPNSWTFHKNSANCYCKTYA